QFCLNIEKQTGVRIFLGIRRTMAKPAAEWLGSEQFQRLAANILVPKDNQRMLNLLRVENENHSTGDGQSASRSMSALLADAYGKQSEPESIGQRIHRSVITAFEQNGLLKELSEEHIGVGLSVEDFLIDYSSLESIETIPTVNPTVLRDS